MTRYRTIVADPPWAYKSTGRNFGADDDGQRADTKDARRQGTGERRDTAPPYRSMSVAEIAALPVGDLAELDAHLYLWTTNRYLRDAFGVVESWGFQVVKPLVWCKAPMGFMGRPYTSSVEFIVFARRGALRACADAGRQWWVWPRGKHSAKPEAFQDLVETVSPGPYLELFARRQRMGWDVWGDEVDSTVEIAA